MPSKKIYLIFVPSINFCLPNSLRAARYVLSDETAELPVIGDAAMLRSWE